MPTAIGTAKEKDRDGILNRLRSVNERLCSKIDLLKNFKGGLIGYTPEEPAVEDGSKQQADSFLNNTRVLLGGIEENLNALDAVVSELNEF